jgi:8-oxo-dGTP diphosphatase
MSSTNGLLLARGPWSPARVTAAWTEEPFEPPAADTAAADAALAALRERGSPSHDGLAARLAGFEHRADGLRLDLQPARWSLRLVGSAATRSVSVLCVVRDADGRWLAGRRASWVATWANRWALGAGGAVEVGESPVTALERELEEEWAVRPATLAVEALVSLPNRLVMLIGQAWLPAGADVHRDAEHDAHAWWPREVDAWPEEADPALREMAQLVEGAAGPLAR